MSHIIGLAGSLRRHWLGGRVMLSSAGKLFDAQGELVDAEARKQLEAFLRGFIAFTKQG